MGTFLTVIFFVFVAIWLISVVGRLAFLWWIARKQEDIRRRFGDGGDPGGNSGAGAFRGFYARFGKNGRKKREGEVTVTHDARRSEYRVGKGVGEYVDYQEVETSDNDGR